MALGASATAGSAILQRLLQQLELPSLLALVPYIAFAFVWLSRWEAARPDEWLLLLRDGQLVSQGIGLRAFRGWRDIATKFPAAMQKVRFQTTQVDRDMQGLDVSGYVSWSVNRDGEGPWNAYKYLAMRDKDGDGNVDSDAGAQHVAEMAKAVLRNHIANTSMRDVLTQREALRDKVREVMMQQIKGWGVWVEAVEIADVRICSNSLFQDLQAEYRHRIRRTAEEARLETERGIKESALAHEVRMAKAQAEAETEKRLAAAQQRLRAEREEAELFAAQAEAARARLKMEEEIELARIAKEAQVRQARAMADAAVAKIEKEAEAERIKVLYDAEREMPAATVKRMVMEATVQACEKLPLREVKLNVFGGEAAGAGSWLPGPAGLMHTWEVLNSMKDSAQG